MTVLITLTTAGTDSGPFDLYSDLDGYLSAFESGVSKASLEGGYASSLVPDYTNIIRVKSNGVFCTNFVNIAVGITTTSTTTTTLLPGPTADAILWDFSYTSTPYTTVHALSISAPENSPVNASVTSNGIITTWVGSTINIEVLASTGDGSEIYSLITVARQLRVSPFTIEYVNSIGGDCIVTNNNINLTILDYDPAYQYIISGVVQPCLIPL